MQIRPRKALTHQDAYEQFSQEQKMQRILEKWVLLLWNTMPVWACIDKLADLSYFVWSISNMQANAL